MSSSSISLFVKSARATLGLTQEQFAELLNRTKGNISAWEHGRHEPPYSLLAEMSKRSGLPLPLEANTGEGPEVNKDVPLISWAQAAKWHAMSEDQQTTECERIATTWTPGKNTFALRVQGDSMEPRFPDGCIIIVEPDEVAKPGAFVIVRHGEGEAVFKQLVQDGGQQLLKPLNARYPIQELHHDAVICGVVKRVEMDV